MKKIIITIITLYQKTLSPDHGIFSYRYPYGCCRYHPSCSQYARLAVEKHGAVKGLYQAAKRVLRCNPWHKGGYDPVK